jgi:hypothetical protein
MKFEKFITEKKKIDESNIVADVKRAINHVRGLMKRTGKEAKKIKTLKEIELQLMKLDDIVKGDKQEQDRGKYK